MKDDPDAPPGWSDNPSSWAQRLPIVVLSLLGFGIAMYLALYQWRVVDRVYEPFFPGQSRKILRESWISKLFDPVPDALLGALGYLGDAVTGLIGGRRRWRTMPWIVVLFGVFVVPLGAVSVALVMAQPLLFDAWCTLCLASAAISLLMIGPATDEVLASLQYLKRAAASGESLWTAFWKGGPPLAPGETPPLPAARGVPWGTVAALAAAAVGVWVMAAPSVLGYEVSAGGEGGSRLAETSDRIAGPVIVAFSTVAAWEVTRALRWVSLVAGAWLMLAPWMLKLPALAGTSDMLSGLAVIALSSVRGRQRRAFGGGFRALRRADGAGQC